MSRAGNRSQESYPPSQEVGTGGTLYQLPNCSICLSELTENLTNLICGHVYHAQCIIKHFTYKTTCPNCQKRSHHTEMRPVFMKFQANSDTRLTDLLKNVTGEERTAVQELTEKLKTTLEQQHNLRQENEDNKRKVEQLTTESAKQKRQLEQYRQENAKMHRDLVVLKKATEEHNREMFMVCHQRQQLQEKVEVYESMRQEFEVLRDIKESLNKDVENITEKKQNFSDRHQLQEGMDYFFQMAMMLRLEARQQKKELLGCHQRLREADMKQRTFKKESEAYVSHIKKLKEEVDKARQRGDRYSDKLKVVAPEMPVESNDNSIGFEVLDDKKLTKKPSSILSDITFKPLAQTKPAGPTLAEQIGVYGGLPSSFAKKSLPTTSPRSFYNR